MPAAKLQVADTLFADHCQLPAVPGWSNWDIRDNEITISPENTRPITRKKL